MNALDGFSSMMGMSGVSSGFTQKASLTDDQKTQVQSILSKYDSKNLTAADAQDIFKQLKDAGITPSKDLRDTVKAAGFNMHELRTLAFNAAQASASSSTSSTTNQGATLTDDQKATVTSILGQYDPKTLTSADAQSIIKQLQQAGIQPGKDLTSTIQAAGFDSKQIASLAAPQGGHHHHHHGGGGGETQDATQTNNVNLSTLQSLQSILDKYNLSNLSSDQQNSLTTELNQSGLLNPGESINITA